MLLTWTKKLKKNQESYDFLKTAVSESYLQLFIFLPIFTAHNSDISNLYCGANDIIHVKVLLVPGRQYSTCTSLFLWD